MDPVPASVEAGSPAGWRHPGSAGARAVSGALSPLDAAARRARVTTQTAGAQSARRRALPQERVLLSMRSEDRLPASDSHPMPKEASAAKRHSGRVKSTQDEPAGTSGTVVPHSRWEDVAAVVTGALLASFGLYLLESGGAVTGGTPGLGLLLAKVTVLPFALAYIAVNLPFVVLAVLRRGWRFTARSATAVALLAGFSYVHPLALPLAEVEPVYAVLLGNLLAGVGRSCRAVPARVQPRGFAVVALECQDRFGWRAGYVQLACDALVLLLSAAVVAPMILLLSVAGAVVLNMVLALNHRPGRYLGV